MSYRRRIIVGLLSFLVLSCSLYASNKESRAAGDATFHSAGCQGCHNADLSGTPKGPDLHGVGKRLKRDALEKQIREGAGAMPAFGDVLTDAQIVQLVDFLESQKKGPKPGKQPVAPPESEKPKPADPE